MHVLLPIKNLNFAKQRLSSLLSATERRTFFQAMLHDVLNVLSQHPLIDGITLVSDDPSAHSLDQQYQLKYISQASLNAHGLSNTIKAGVSFLAQQNINDAMVLHGDLPLISVDEVSKLIYHYNNTPKPAITLTPDRRGTGTNCIICPTQTDFEFHYGDHSFEKHRAQALLCDVKAHVVEQKGISCDIDYPHDLLQFLTQASTNNATRTQQFLRDHMIIDRLLNQPLDQQSSSNPPGLATVVNFALKQGRKNYAT